MQHVVVVKQVWFQYVLVDADSCAEAKQIVNNDEYPWGVLAFKFAYAMDSNHWGVQPKEDYDKGLEAGSDGTWHG